ncbi:6575_t:CDS:2 [Paraglomus occultum]|uniref:6575_t:CDS:1 n=1 Tax=Paraglomus occultum TaxID=144539 RepID=A0A9N8ZIK2_9GLOM|nr:6575_t:CDS:2 [Paraglomus occultum]
MSKGGGGEIHLPNPRKSDMYPTVASASDEARQKFLDDTVSFFKDLKSDVEIKVGEGSETETFHINSTILKIRSPYFKAALSNRWNHTTPITLYEPTISPFVFTILYKYICEGVVDSLKDVEPECLLKIMQAADRLLLPQLVKIVELHVVRKHCQWLKDRLNILPEMFKYSGWVYIQAFYINHISQNPEKFFGSQNFTSMDVKIIESVINSNELAMDEINVWDNLIKWGEKQPGGLDGVKKTLESLTPLIRFVSIPANSFYEKVKPHKRFIPEDLYEEALWAYILNKPKQHLQNPRATRIDSNFITPHHAVLLSDWVDGKAPDTYSTRQLPYDFELLVRGSRDGFDGNTFYSKCKTVAKTIIIIKVRDSDELIGGYNPSSWQTDYSNKDSFIFSIKDWRILDDVVISRVRPTSTSQAVTWRRNGLNFGDGDLALTNPYNNVNAGQTRPKNYDIKIRDGEVFTVEEYEVFALKGQRC